MNHFWIIFFTLHMITRLLCGGISDEITIRQSGCLLVDNCMSISNERGSSMLEEKSLEAFETEIAYFFGVNDQQPVVEAYISALKKLDEIGLNKSEDLLEKEIVPYLEDAYKSIAQQRNWHFNTHLAAQIELQVILGNAK